MLMDRGLALPRQPPVKKKVNINSARSPEAQYISMRRGGLAESLEETAKPNLDVVWLRARNSTDDGRKPNNPFVLPDADIFKKREVDSVIKQQEKKFFTSLPVYMKGTYLTRLRCRSNPMRIVGEIIPETETCSTDKTALPPVVTTGCQQQRENIRDYLSKQREMFRLQYSLSVKRETIKQLEKDMLTAHQRISTAEKQLEEDSITFEKFIKESDQNSVEAVQLAEKETVIKMEKTTEIKKVTAQIMAMKSDISKYQDILKEYQTYRKFLTAVAPAEWREEQRRRRAESRAAKAEPSDKQNKDLHSPFAKEDKKASPIHGRRDSRVTKMAPGRRQSKGGKAGLVPGIQDLTLSELPDTEPSSDEEPLLFFSEPREMLNVLTDLEEQNLSCIQNFQETEEALDEIRKNVQLTQDKMNSETEILQQQIDILKNTIQREEEKASELVLKCKIFSYGEYRADKQDAMLNVLHKTVKEVYRTCVGEMDSNISTLHMLADIENRMEEVLDRLEIMPPEKVEAVKNKREVEKRLKMREEKMQLKKCHQEERLRLALERATCDTKKQTGRKMMPRSEPAEVKKNSKIHVMTTREQEDALYFFT